MGNELTKVEIGVGLGKLVFGMSQKEVKALMGEPDKISKTGLDESIVYYYNTFLIKLLFGIDEDLKMSLIEVYNPDVQVFNQRIMGKSKREIIDFLKIHNCYEIEEEDYGSLETVFCKKIWVEFEFDFNKLTGLGFRPLYDCSAEVVWPIKPKLDSLMTIDAETTETNRQMPRFKKDAIMKLNIGVGLGKLVFGMSQKEVKTLMGEPDKILDTEIDDVIIYYFYEPMFKTKFDLSEDGKMYSIEIYNPASLMFNKMVIGMRRRDIMYLLSLNGYTDLVEYDYDFFETIFCRAIWTTFEFEFDRLVGIEFSPLYGDDNAKYIWPTRL